MISPRWKWLLLFLVTLAGALCALHFLGFTGWVLSWVGAAFKAASGGAIGYFVGRFVCGIDLSEIEPAYRQRAGQSMATLIAGFALAVAIGA
jgi:hypothetical protein